MVARVASKQVDMVTTGGATAPKKKKGQRAYTNSNVRQIQFDDIVALHRTAVDAGVIEGRAHSALAVRLEKKHAFQLAEHRATQAWDKATRRQPELVKAWSGHKPTFVANYSSAFLAGYSLQTQPLVVAPERMTKEEKRAHAANTRFRSSLQRLSTVPEARVARQAVAA